MERPKARFPSCPGQELWQIPALLSGAIAISAPAFDIMRPPPPHLLDAAVSSPVRNVSTAKPGSPALNCSVRNRLLEALVANAPAGERVERSLSKVIADVTANPGGMLRAELAWLAAGARGFTPERADLFACAIEYFHTASLLFDDLPAMDDSTERRGRICSHLLHGEGFAILGALALITRAYGLLGELVSNAPCAVQSAAHRFIETCLGTAGLINGQAFDLNFQKSHTAAVQATRVALGKTVPMLRLAMLLPVILSEGSACERRQVNGLSVYWGLFYQGVDDVMDVGTPASESGKTAGRDLPLGRPNIVRQFGRKGARTYLDRLLKLAGKRVSEMVEGDSAAGYLTEFQGKLERRWACVEGRP